MKKEKRIVSKKERAIALVIVILCLVALLALLTMITIGVMKKLTKEPPTDAYLGYEEVSGGVNLSFDIDRDTEWDAYYDAEDGYTYFYYNLNDTDPEKMILFSKARGGAILGTRENALLYQPDAVEDPYRELSPTGAVLLLDADKNGEHVSSRKVEIDDTSYLENFWNMLLEDSAERMPNWDILEVGDFTVRCELNVYLDSGKRVYVSAMLLDSGFGEDTWFWRIYRDDQKRAYYLSCNGILRETVEDFLRELYKGEPLPFDPVPEVTEMPAMTVSPQEIQSPEWSECAVMK